MTHWLTTIVSTSPSPADPETSTIQRTIRKVREYPELRDEPIIVMFDGVYDNLRYPSQADLEINTGATDDILKKRTERYVEYKSRLLPWCAENNVQTIVFATHTHRANMTRETLKQIQTPCVMPLDHDVYPVGDIPWETIRGAMEDDRVNSIRLYYLSEIHPDHKHLMSKERELINGVPLLKTIQYGDRPNIQKSDFLRYILEKYVGKKSECFIEDIMWPVCFNAGWDRWNEFKLWLYAPDGDTCRCMHKFSRADKTSPRQDLSGNVFPISATVIDTP